MIVVSRWRALRRAVTFVVLGALLALAAGPGADSASAADQKTLDEYFNGQIVALEGKQVTIRYDFRKKDQAKDFTDNVPWPITRRKDQGVKWFDEKLEVVGNSGARHVAEWKGDVEVKVRVHFDHDKDIGAWLSPINGANDYATFTFREFFFHTWNKKTGGQDSIIKFGNQWREKGSTDDYIGFRYIARRPPKEVPTAGETKEMTFGIQKGKLLMTTDEFELKGKDRGKKLKQYFIGFYAIKGRALFDNIEITGTLNDAWVRHVGLELKTSKPINAEKPTELDDETKALIADHKTGKRSKATRELVDLLKDVTVARPVRVAIRDALFEGPKMTARYAQDLLYSRELEVREDGIEIIKAHLGKDWAFNPKGSEGSRRKAITAMNEELKKKPGMLKD